MERYAWSKLNHLQVGKYAEYFVKMEFTLYGWQVFASEVDDRGIDLAVRRTDGHFYEVQVKSVRETGYVFMTKKNFDKNRDNLIAAILIFQDGKLPSFYLIPALAWQHPNDLLVDHDYEGLKSKPEWGVNLSKKNMPLLEEYRFDRVLESLTAKSVQPSSQIP